MFYVAGTKIYLARFDDTRKVYPEVKLTKRGDGVVVPSVQPTGGITKKPANRRLCNLKEVLAQFHTDEPEDENEVKGNKK